MLLQIFAVFVMLGILSVLIIVHECGHFSVARFFGFQTPVFGFGLPFGPHWVVGKKWGTEFRIHACLLGGYVAIPELGDESNAGPDAFGVPLQPFKKFPIWQRALVAFAGVGFNMLFAYLVTIAMFLSIGQPVSTTIIDNLPPDNTLAAQAGVKVGDQLVGIDDIKVTDSGEAISYLGAHKSTPVKIHVLRADEPVTIEVTTNANGKVGMALLSKDLKYQKVEGNFFDICGLAFNKLCKITWQLVDQLRMLVEGLAAGGKAAAGRPAIGLGDLHGVLAVIKIGADIAQQDWSQLFIFTIMISMDLAIINLVPWPALDGGHLAFMTFEAVRGKPMGERAQGEIVKWGFLGLMVLMVVIMANDVTALVTGKLDYKKKDVGAAGKDGKKDAVADPKSPGDKAVPASGADKASPDATSEKPANTPADKAADKAADLPADKPAPTSKDSEPVNAGDKH